MGGEKVLYHYVVTLQWQAAGGIAANTLTGTWPVYPGDTRSEIYDEIFGGFCRDKGIPEAVTMFFTLEPDLLLRTSREDLEAGK